MNRRTLGILTASLLVAACGGKEGKEESHAPPEPASEAPAFALHVTEDVPTALRVNLVKEAAEVGKDVAVVGRIRALANGVLTIVDDETVKYCGQDPDSMEGCPTPWDYCCTTPSDLRESSLTVEVRDVSGREVPKDVMGLRLLDLVAFDGTLSRDDTGTFVLTTKGRWFRRERPDLPDNLEWPD